MLARTIACLDEAARLLATGDALKEVLSGQIARLLAMQDAIKALQASSSSADDDKH